MNKTENTLRKVIQQIQPVDEKWIQQAAERTAQLVMPPRALGRLHDISERLCGIQKTLTPLIKQKAVIIMAGDHGVAVDGVSAYPQAVTGEMVKTFLNGVAGINAIARYIGAQVNVVDMGIIPDVDPALFENADHLSICKIARGTHSIARGPAMSREDAVCSILTGFEKAGELFSKGVGILGTGDMGIGNTTPSAAIGTVITGTGTADMVGRGTGVDDAGLAVKREIVQRAIQINQPDAKDGIDVLAKVGGFEIGGIAGVVLAAALHGRPVVIDGFISTAGALIAHTLCPLVNGYLFAGHCSAEPGHIAMLNHLGHSPILDLGMRLGEGTGGALTMGIMEAAVRMFTQVATFDEAGVSDKEPS